MIPILKKKISNLFDILFQETDFVHKLLFVFILQSI
jgi:hypothetical protein